MVLSRTNEGLSSLTLIRVGLQEGFCPQYLARCLGKLTWFISGQLPP